MTGRAETFAADWLSLREPADHAARSTALAALLDRHFGRRESLRVVDLGAGQGSNLRWLAPRLSMAQHWLLVDHDEGLLKQATRRTKKSQPAADISVETRRLDLASADLNELASCDLVTGSALLDLVSQEWIDALAEACCAQRSAAFFALSVNGFWRWFSEDGNTIETDDDIFTQHAFNLHQRRDKGLGAALGPAAADALCRAFAARGYRVDCRSGNWQLPPNQRLTLELGPPLLNGWQRAACEETGETQRIGQWHDQRLKDMLAGHLGVEVGHLDCLALPVP